MQEREILDHAKQAIDAIAPDCFEHIWEKSSTVDPMQYPLPDPPNAVFHKKSQVKRNLILSISILAACLLCVFGLRWRGQVTVYTTINLDVNPSISICLNHSGDILSVSPQIVSHFRDCDVVVYFPEADRFQHHVVNNIVLEPG